MDHTTQWPMQRAVTLRCMHWCHYSGPQLPLELSPSLLYRGLRDQEWPSTVLPVQYDSSRPNSSSYIMTSDCCIVNFVPYNFWDRLLTLKTSVSVVSAMTFKGHWNWHHSIYRIRVPIDVSQYDPILYRFRVKARYFFVENPEFLYKSRPPLVGHAGHNFEKHKRALSNTTTS